MPRLRSFHAFSSLLLGFSLSNYKLLRVLNLASAPLEHLPNDVVHLFNLRYLSIRETQIRELPEALGRLCNLQVLDAAYTQIETLPSGVTKLENLKHLMVYSVHRKSRFRNPIVPVQVPKGIWNMKGLQTLKAVIPNHDLIQNLASMTKMRTFYARNVSEGTSSDLFASVARMDNLLQLSIGLCEDVKVDLNLYSLPPQLKRLKLGGELESGMLPYSFRYLSNLTRVDLASSCLAEASILFLSKLPDLKELNLVDAYDGQRLHFAKGSFPKLQSLGLWELNNLNCIDIEKEALVSLKSLWLVSCTKLKLLPIGLRNLTCLRRLVLDNMPNEFTQRLRGVDKSTDVRHISYIESWFQKDGHWVREILS